MKENPHQPMKSREAALDALDQVVARCLATTDEEFVLELRRLGSLCHGSPLLLAAVADCMKQFEDRANTFLVELRGGEGQAVKLRDDLIKSCGGQLPALSTPAARGVPGPFAQALSLEAFSRLEAESGASGPTLDRLEEMLKILSWQISCVQAGDPNPPSEVVALKRRLSFLEEKAAWLDRERSNHLRLEAGACWYEIEKWTARINPAPVENEGPLDFQTIFDAALESLASPPIEKVLYGKGPASSVRRPTKEENERFRAWRKSFQVRLERFRDDVSYRVRTAASRDSHLRRYAARCMWFRREELSGKIRTASGAGRAGLERLLADDAAAYLFDCGLFVLTEVNLRPARMDLVADAGDELLLIEAKVYGSNRGGLDAATQGLIQLLDYAADLAAGGLPTSNYLLLFRNGGKRFAWPTEAFEVQGTRVEIVHVDVSPSSDKGSKAGPPESCTVEDLCRRVSGVGAKRPENRTAAAAAVATRAKKDVASTGRRRKPRRAPARR